MTDSSGPVDEMQVNIHRGLSRLDRLRTAFAMSALARGLARARLRARHPEWSERAISRELARWAAEESRRNAP